MHVIVHVVVLYHVIVHVVVLYACDCSRSSALCT